MTKKPDVEDLSEFDELIAEVKAAGEVPEPSPLFWTHLSARVREAVGDAPPAGRWWRPYWRPLLAVAGTMATLVVVLVLRTSAVHRGAPVPGPAAAGSEVVADVEVSEMWRLVGTAAPKMEMDSAADAGLMPASYATDAAIESLTPAERDALVRLLRREMGVSE